MAVENNAGLFDEGSDGVADDFFLDATRRGGLADDQVDALLRLEGVVSLGRLGGHTVTLSRRDKYLLTAKSPIIARRVFSRPGMSAMRRMM